MERTIEVLCRNNGTTMEMPIGSTVYEAYEAFSPGTPPICAEVNNREESMNYVMFSNCDIKFLDLASPSGMRTYTRSLFFVLCKAFKDVYPQASVRIDTPVSNGYYCRVLGIPEITGLEIKNVKARMNEIIAADKPFRRIKAHTDDVAKRFREAGMDSKAKLMETCGCLYSTYHMLESTMDYFYGPLLPSTGGIWLFGIEKYHDGVLLRLPDPGNPQQLRPLVKQEKMFGVFSENHKWQTIMGLNTIGDLNDLVAKGMENVMINVSEALQEKKISNIAEKIAERKDVKVVLISGPSSSGKTTFSKRLSIQLAACGLKPFAVSMDDYFVDREKTPKSPDGEYDFESVHALNIPMLSRDLGDLIAGKRVELPRYNFHTGKSEKSGVTLKIEDNMILVIEGIHALNPELTRQIDEKNKFRIYVSALTSILLDDHNYIPTTDNRLLRRIVRDYKYRGYSARDTIRRWPSVKAGEEKWIFPYQENADVMFNSALIYELAVLKLYAEPLLFSIDRDSEEYLEAKRLLKFLDYFLPMPGDGINQNSILREFIGGSCFNV